MNLKHIEQITEYLDINHEKIVEKENEYLETMDHYKDIWEDTKDFIDNFNYMGLDVDIKRLNECISHQKFNSNMTSIRYELMKAKIGQINGEEMEVCTMRTANGGKEYYLNEETNYLYDKDTCNIVGKYNTYTDLILYMLYSKVRGC